MEYGAALSAFILVAAGLGLAGGRAARRGCSAVHGGGDSSCGNGCS